MAQLYMPPYKYHEEFKEEINLKNYVTTDQPASGFQFVK